jgi:phage-related protein
LEPWKLEHYESASGDQPVLDYIDALPMQEAARVTKELDLLAEFGTELRGPHVKRLQGSRLWELRVRGRNQYRVFYVAQSGRRFLLLHAFTKKSQRTPHREIQVAEPLLSDYERRHSS